MVHSFPKERTGKLRGDQTCIFVSCETCGTGVSQSIAHCLGYTPTKVWAVLTTQPLAGNSAIAFGTHDATNLQVSSYSDQKFIAYAY